MARLKAVRLAALVLGIVLFVAAILYMDVDAARVTVTRLGVALPLALLFSAIWHLARTIAWAWCFPQPSAVGFARLARVRLAAEAFSYLTLRGIAGEPLKVVLLVDRVGVRQATAAVALERVAYMTGTTVIVGIASAVAIALLPLSDGWYRVFRAFAIGAGALTAIAALVITGRGVYLQSFLRGIDRGVGTSLASGRTGTFVASVERQMLELVRGNPRRLAMLMAMTAAAYVCMALEAWVILRATGVSVTATGAIAVETFSRVASFASAFIPANLGALEISSLAAASAVGVGAGGAALAIARRIRGLFWAAVGLAVYPQPATGATDNTDNTEATGNTGSEFRPRTNTHSADRHLRPRRMARVLLYFPKHAAVLVEGSTRVAGLPIAERIVRAARRAGYDRVIVWLPEHREPDGRLRSVLRSVDGVEIVSSSAAWRDAIAALPPASPLTAVGAGTVVSPALFEAALLVMPRRHDVLDVPAGARWPEAGVIRLTAADAVEPEDVAEELSMRRRRALPLPSGESVADGHAMLALRIVSPDDLEGAERTMRRASYKDTDSKLARFNRRISLPISVALIRTPLTANQLSVLLVALGFYSAWLFSIGHYWTGVLAAFLSLAASILDGCDGEIARLKYQESALGCWIETVGDYSYYIAIFAGLTTGAVRQTGWDGFYWIGGLALAATLVAFALLIFLRSRITAGRPEKLHAIARARFTAEPTLWSRIVWRLSFCATRAAMPYGIMAFALVNLLPAIVVLAAIGANVYWISLVVKLRDLLGGHEQERVAA